MNAVNVITGEVREDITVFDSIWRPDIKTPEASDSKDTKTEQGYIPPQQQIADMERAGIALQATRRARFDSDLYPEGTLSMDIALDPYRNKAADIVDLVKTATETGARLRDQDAKAREAAAAAEAAARDKATQDLAATLVGKTAQEIDALLKTAQK